MTKLSDQWQTPQALFDELNAEFHFDVDLCATKENRKTECWYRDYLNEKVCRADRETDMSAWNCAFMNPPYSNPKPFIEKAWEDSKHCKIVCLVKCDPSTRWWTTFWDHAIVKELGDIDGTGMMRKALVRPSGPKPGCEVRFFPKRIKFDPPQELIASGDVVNIKGVWFRVKHGVSGAGPYTYNEKLSGPTFSCALVIMDRQGLLCKD